ncbi:hypothetical protein UlMin_040134 [Ulmus minor]
MDTKMPYGGAHAPAEKTAATLAPKADLSLASRVLGGRGRSTARLSGSRFDGHLDTRALGTSDESELSKKIVDTHESDQNALATKPVLHIIELIFHRATVDLPGFIQGSGALLEDTDEKAFYSAASLQDNVEIPARITSTISCEIFSKCSVGVDVHTITMDILRLIKHYSWDSKVVLALIPFAVSFGEFRLVVKHSTANPLAKGIALLKQLPEILEHMGDLKPKLNALFELIKEILDVTTKIVEFYELPRQEYYAADSPELNAAVSHIPTAVYWTIRSIVVSATQIYSLTGMGIEYLTEPWELSSLAYKLNNIKGHLMDLIERCLKFIQKRKDDEAYAAFIKIVESTHIDNSRPLRAFFYNKDQTALYDCYNKRRVSIEELRRKVVVLFITDLNPDVTRQAEYAIVQQMYAEKKQAVSRTESQYEVVWVPVEHVWSEDKLVQFDSLRNQMEWYSIHHPSVVDPVVIRYIRERWNFSKKPLLVVMDAQGNIVHRNAIHMMCIWGSQAYPFTTNRERLLWEANTWSMELLADHLHPNLNTWIQEGRHICLYGGEDLDWIRKFTRTAKDAAREAGVALELLYVGRSKPKERTTRTVLDTIQQENLSRALDLNLIWYFWVRMESMWHSKGQLVSSENVKNDPIMLGIIAMLSFGSSDQGWAVISRGFDHMVKGNGEHMFKGLNERTRWRPREQEIGFLPALDEYLRQLHVDAPHHCTSLILPATGAMPETVACSECGRLMERYTMFRCCLE